MSLDFTHNYSSHTLTSNENFYSDIYLVTPTTPTEVHKGDIILVKSPCGKSNLFMVAADPLIGVENPSLELVEYSPKSYTKESQYSELDNSGCDCYFDGSQSHSSCSCNTLCDSTHGCSNCCNMQHSNCCSNSQTTTENS